MKKFLTLLPIAFSVARVAEESVPLPGKGKEKLAFALDVAQAGYGMEEELRASYPDKSQFSTAIAKAVTLAVGVLNAAGVFKHGK